MTLFAAIKLLTQTLKALLFNFLLIYTGLFLEPMNCKRSLFVPRKTIKPPVCNIVYQLMTFWVAINNRGRKSFGISTMYLNSNNNHSIIIKNCTRAERGNIKLENRKSGIYILAKTQYHYIIGCGSDFCVTSVSYLFNYLLFRSFLLYTSSNHTTPTAVVHCVRDAV